ncbi:MAG: flippase-like domain-containing protein [Deltaproteobacteria bacterium]|nr:flippase-like domain-containing protein [Deltaproteobacteria bacterium]
MDAQPAPVADSPGRGVRWLKSILKLVVSALLVAGILWKVPVKGALSALSALSVWTVLAIVVLTFLFPVIAALRWKRALGYAGARQAWWPLLVDTLVSCTYNMLLPTQLGGDVVRALRCAKRLPEGHHAWSSMIFERLMGVVALVLLAVPGLLMGPAAVREIGVAVGIIALLSVLLVVFAHTPFRLGARMLVSRAPSIAGAGERIAADLAGPLATTRARVEMMAWSSLYQIVGLGILVVVVWDWGMPSMAWAVLGAIPLALVLTLLPVSIAGIGVRESLFVVLLGRFGMSSDRALSLAVVWLASALLTALAGSALMALESIRPSRALPRAR